MASPQIELEPYEQVNYAEDQHTYEDMMRDHEDKSADQKHNKIVHEVINSCKQWTKIFVLTLIVSIVSACTVLTVSYFSLFAELGVKIEQVEKNHAFLDNLITVIDNGNWTVFQRRIDGTTDFFRGWEEYKNGFGNLEAEFWLGNRKINEITSKGLHELRVDLTDFEGNTGYAKYSTFSVGHVSTQYKLEVGGYSGNIGESLLYNNGMSFSTKDRDNDRWTRKCANNHDGAWWYHSCTYANLNGHYFEGGQNDVNGITWYHWKSSLYSVKSSVMMFRKVYPPG